MATTMPLATSTAPALRSVRRVASIAGLRAQPVFARPSTGVRTQAYKSQYRADTSKAQNNANEAADDAQEKLTEVVDTLKEKWDAVEEKPAAVAITIAAFIAIWASSGLIDSINKLPVIGGVLELVGLFVTGWFVYRYALFGPDREELKQNVESFTQKVTGKKQL